MIKNETVSIVIPMHNEEKNIDWLLKEIINVLKKMGLKFEIIPVNDVSIDDTGKIINNWSRKYSFIKPIHRKGERGVGRALKSGFKKASGDVIVTMDGDFSHDPKEIPILLKKMENTNADLILGSRYIEQGEIHHKLSRKIISKGFNLFAKFLIGIDVNDLTTGFRAHKKKLLADLDLKSDGFDIHVEIPIKAFKKGYKIREVPIHYLRRKYGKSKLKYTKVWFSYIKHIFD